MVVAKQGNSMMLEWKVVTKAIKVVRWCNSRSKTRQTGKFQERWKQAQKWMMSELGDGENEQTVRQADRDTCKQTAETLRDAE